MDQIYGNLIGIAADVGGKFLRHDDVEYTVYYKEMCNKFDVI